MLFMVKNLKIWADNERIYILAINNLTLVVAV